MMSVAFVRAVWRSQSAATVWTTLMFDGMPFWNPDSRAPLVTSPEIPPMRATSPPDGRSVPISLPAFEPASVLSVPMYVASFAFAAWAAEASIGLSMLTIGTFLAASCATPWMRFVPLIGLTMKHANS